ncbi:MAG: SufS family cysteine desulfurase [Sumerlaeia bacterium]
MTVAETPATNATLDVEALRREFPILAQTVHDGKPLVYLDNAATTQKPRAVLDALAHYYEADNSNIHRGVHILSQRATDAYEGARSKIRDFLNAASDHEIIYTRGCTEGINLVAQSWGRANLKPGDEVLVTWMEHHSNIVPWQMVCEQTGATLRVVPIHDDGSLDMEAFARMLSGRTKFVSVVHVSNSLGTVNPVEDIVARAHATGAKVLVDGAQAVQHMAVDVRALDCDFYTLSGHKLFGPTGIGVLYGKEALLNEMPPWQGGGDMIQTVSFEGSTWNVLPWKFEAGTPHIAGGVGLGAAVDFVREVGLENIAAAEHELLRYGTEKLSAIPGLRLIGTAAKKTSVLSFVVDGIHATDLGALIDNEGVAVRVGHHCTQPIMDRFGVPGTVRASLAFYNTKDDIDRLVAALEKALALHGGSAEGDPADHGNESITAAQSNIVREFSQFTEWEDRYQRIIEVGNRMPDIPEQYKDARYIVKGCQSTVYLHASPTAEGKIHYEGSSDAMIVRGLIALLLRVYNDRTPDEIIATPPEFIHQLGLNDNLTQGRANGLRAMIEQIKLYAAVLKQVLGARG